MNLFGWIAGLFGGGGRRTLEQDIPKSADWIAEALNSSGYKADFSPASIAEVERFFSEQTLNGAPKPGGLLAEGLGGKLFALGSYCGEVLRRELGGAWKTDDADPKGEVNAALDLGNGSTCWPMQRMVKRVWGDEANLVHWAAVIRDELGEPVDLGLDQG